MKKRWEGDREEGDRCTRKSWNGMGNSLSGRRLLDSPLEVPCVPASIAISKSMRFSIRIHAIMAPATYNCT